MIVRPVVEKYAEDATSPPGEDLGALVAETEAVTDLPAMMVGPLTGELLATFVFALRPQRILEIGTFTGYSALRMAEAMDPQAHLVTCEIDPHHAAVARRHIEASPYRERITLLEGPALESIARLDGVFDLVFLDADKTGYLDYYDAVLPRLSSRGLILADNVLQFGGVANERDDRPDTVAMRRFNERVAADPRVRQVLLTVREGLTVIRRADAGGMTAGVTAPR
jgi:caffeoyl-CoA O-methyltransferase